MIRGKYPERDSLCEYDLSLEFFEALGLDIKDVTPLRKVFVITTNQGKKILKKVDYAEDRINFISSGLEFLKSSYPNVISYDKLKNGLNYLKWNGNIYVVMDILDGRESSFANPVELELCGKNTALMHKGSKGCYAYLNKKMGRNCLNSSFPDKVQQNIKDLKYIKSVVEKYENKNGFDRLFLANADKYINALYETCEEIKNSAYEDLRKNPENIVICHSDLAYHNFLIKGTDEVNIIDFDFMNLDLKIFDVCDFLLKSVKNAAYDYDKFMAGLNAYKSAGSLSEEEEDLMYIILKYPRDICTIVKDYYFKKKKWPYDVFLSRFKNKLYNEPFREELLKAVKSE